MLKMKHTLIKNAVIVNEGLKFEADLLITDGRIAKITSEIQVAGSHDVVDAKGYWLLPGAIDDQVHFREPGLQRLPPQAA